MKNHEKWHQRQEWPLSEFRMLIPEKAAIIAIRAGSTHYTKTKAFSTAHPRIPIPRLPAHKNRNPTEVDFYSA